MCAEVYTNADKSFTVEKQIIGTSIGYDTEKYDDEIIKINGMDAVCFRSDNETIGIIYNNGEYIYAVTGNISKEEAVKVAQNIK